MAVSAPGGGGGEAIDGQHLRLVLQPATAVVAASAPQRAPRCDRGRVHAVRLAGAAAPDGTLLLHTAARAEGTHERLRGARLRRDSERQQRWEPQCCAAERRPCWGPLPHPQWLQRLHSAPPDPVGVYQRREA